MILTELLTRPILMDLPILTDSMILVELQQQILVTMIQTGIKILQVLTFMDLVIRTGMYMLQIPTICKRIVRDPTRTIAGFQAIVMDLMIQGQGILTKVIMILGYPHVQAIPTMALVILVFRPQGLVEIHTIILIQHFHRPGVELPVIPTLHYLLLAGKQFSCIELD